MNFTPKNYSLNLNLNRIDRNFTGSVLITGKSSNDAIVLHSKDLEIKSIAVNGEDKKWRHGDLDELRILDSPLGDVKIEITYSGNITDNMTGLYPCYYEHNGEKKELLATQFESHYARQVFPCVDEPEAKATFDVTLTTEKDITVLGNMPIIERSEDENSQTTTFDTTPIMSTYLLAFVAGELHSKQAFTKSGIEVNVFATPAQSQESLDFGLDIATRTIDFFEEYFDTPYPLPKSDHVALPDFSSGAMENWGLITYRETALLADPKTTSPTDRHYAATVIAHELSHQWFGNLVTMKWWNDLWLNESFASIMENVAVDALEPSWNIWLMEATSGIPSALGRDSLNGVQSVRTDVNHPDEIQTIFDPSIVYAKGSRLLLMLQAYIGESAMRKGLKSYFDEFKYKNTIAEDLWKHLSATSGKNVSDFIDSWINKPGYPVVYVSLDNKTLKISQEQFYIGQKGAGDTLWNIPLKSNNPDLPELLSEKEILVKTSDRNIRLNTGATGHYIVNYSDELLEGIFENIDQLETIDRLYLLHEQMLLIKAGLKPSSELVKILKVYKNETDNNVWDVLSGIVAELRKFIEPDSDEDKALKKIVSELTEKEFQRLGWKSDAESSGNEPEEDIKQRANIISLKLYAGDKNVSEEAKKRFSIENIDLIDAELRASIIAHSVKEDSSNDTIEKLLEVYKKHQNSGVRDDISVGIAATKNIESIKHLSTIIKDRTYVKPQDFTYWFVRLLRNRYGRDYMWKWAQENWQWIKATFEGDSHFDTFPRYIAGSLATDSQLKEYSNFFEPMKNEISLKRNIELGLVELKAKVDLINRDKEGVSKALLENI